MDLYVSMVNVRIVSNQCCLNCEVLLKLKIFQHRWQRSRVVRNAAIVIDTLVPFFFVLRERQLTAFSFVWRSWSAVLNQSYFLFFPNISNFLVTAINSLIRNICSVVVRCSLVGIAIACCHSLQRHR